MKKILGVFLLAICAVGLTACGQTEDKGEYTYNDYLTVSPSNWNELTYQDNNDTQIMNYVGSNFFVYDYKFDANGKIVPGDFEIKYSAATKLEDVTKAYAGKDSWGIAADETNYRAYKITLREDLKWEDGTQIKADDFVYTMQQQLDPKFQNYRADSFYTGSTIIHNAENYFKQGQTSVASVKSMMTNYGNATIADFLKDHGTEKAYVNWDLSFGDTYVDGEWTGESADETVDSGLTLSVLYKLFSDTVIGWGYDQATADGFFVAEASGDYKFPDLTFDKVGMFVGDTDYEIVLILDAPLALLKDDGSLSYKAAYNMASLPCVNRTKFEANKHEPQSGSTLWTSTYNSDKETTMSWGPYKLESFQAGKQYVLVKNDQWYGYGMDLYKDQYQTTKIKVEIMKEWNSAWLKFQAGEIDGIGIDVSIATDYKGSERAYYTPDDFVASLQLQSDNAALKSREKDGVNKTILTYTDFRKALSLSIDRTEFAKKTTTSSLAGYGLFNSMHYYDVENGGVYRNTDAAKQVLCDVYAVDVTKYDSLDAAAATITGYNLAEARKLVDKAYDAALAAGDIKATDKVSITMGSGAINDVVKRRFNFIKDAWMELVKGTKLEGKLEIPEYEDHQTNWAKDFRAGMYDVCMGGWTGAAWDPGYFLLAYLSPSYMYSQAWDTANITMEFTMPGVGENGADVKDTLSLLDWYGCLNGSQGAKYNWGAGALPEAKRLLLIAALEKQVLSVYYTVPLYNNYAASLLSYKVEYVSYDYNTFMAYGGIRYMKYNYNDAQWADFVKAQGNQIDYTA